ncbi:molybdopterin molybdotransferase MoeA [Nocardiopsis sp. CNT312]|uniref:molybdopterin molybdotransferase MoeA n=1 Tax=Nocardiopsis sp. CNT312 TaxID=1137268 RepID=UPI000491DEF2|nr:molybdopterin molybdotransferase MoeA [Nocardiopsis sp. CNT312]
MGRTWAEARAVARRLGGERAPGPREVPLERALGAVLGADLRALVGLPAFDAAAMDGYAVAGAGPWRLVGAHLAGASAVHPGLRPGEAVEIATGARVPKGAEAVLPYEHAVTGAGGVEGHIDAGRHVRWEGEETAPGETVLARGAEVTPAVLGLAASLGHESLPVVRPRVDVVVTGDEVAPSGLPGEGTVRDAIGPMLPGIVGWAGAEVGRVRHLGDDRRMLRECVTGAEADVVAVCGSSSQGPADHFRAVLGEIGAETVVDGVACRPGHPQVLASAGPTVLVGLPGHPGAALVAALTLLVPLLTGMAGRPDPARVAERVPLAGDVRPHHRDTRLVAVCVGADGARPAGRDRPGSLREPARADAYAVVPPGWDGSEVELVRLF